MTIALQLSMAAIFLLINVAVVTAILQVNRRVDQTPVRTSAPPQFPPGPRILDAEDILGKEYLYAQSTASEALRDRYTMINFYLLFVGFVMTGAIAVARDDAGNSKVIGTVLLWLLSSVGWLYFLKIIRLRQAWYDSARAMNQIKEFYITFAQDVPSDWLRSAFRWQPTTLPAPEKPWTLFFLAAMTVAFLDSMAFFLGGLLLDLNNARSSPLLVAGVLGLLGLALLWFYAHMYMEFLRERKG